MKSLTAVCQTGASMPAINPNGRISRHPPHRGDGENAEMKMYLSKLKDLVPFMPKNRKLSKLEIIQHVIDYICDLQSELETHPEISNFDAAAALNFTANLERVSAANDEDGDDEEDEEMYEGGVQDRLNGSMLQQQQSSPAQRQPLVDRQTPNTILPATQHQQQQQQQHLNVSAISNTTTSNSITTTNSSSGNSSASAVTSSTAVNPTTTTSTTAAVNTAVASNLTHTLNPEKDLDSRQTC